MVPTIGSAQVNFLPTEESIGTSLDLPIALNEIGQLTFINRPGMFSVAPSVQLGLSMNNVSYSVPSLTSEFKLSAVDSQNKWIDVRRTRYEAGLGASAIVSNYVNVGLSPYLGGIMLMTRMKNTQEDETSKDIRMPKELTEMLPWGVGDHGLYQTYGGVQAYLGAGAGPVNLLKGSVGFQNQFIVEIRKLNEHQIVFKIAEEGLTRQEAQIGPLVAELSLDRFRGHRFVAHFNLDIQNPEHQKLFRQGIAGKINVLQTTLSSARQTVSWDGTERNSYYGIPYIRGMSQRVGEYGVIDNNRTSEFFISTRKNSGMFITPGLHQKIAYAMDSGVILFWNSEMKNVSAKTLDKYFLKIGRTLGLKGFDQDVTGLDFGSVLSQIGLIITQKELLAIKDLNIDMIESELQNRCEMQQLECRNPRHMKRLMRELKRVLALSWRDMKADFGRLLVREPALIVTVMKMMNIQKRAYLKFLNNNFQSLQGNIPLENVN